MKKVTLVINEALCKKLGISNSADDTAVAEAISNMADKAAKADQLQNQLDTLKTEKETLQNDIKTQAEAEMKTLLEAAVADGRMTKEESDVYAEQFANNLDGLKKVLNARKAYEPKTKGLGAGGSENKTKADQAAEYDKMHQSGELQACKKENWEKYEQVFEAKFGRKPTKK